MIYADNNATSPIDPTVWAAMRPYFEEKFFNPSSPYTPARGASLAVSEARERVASFLGSREDEVIFTSGGTEANATAIHLARMWHPDRRHWICSAVEHASVLEPFAALEKEGHCVTRIPANRDGTLDLDVLRASLSQDTALVGVMLANNETGVVHPLLDVVAAARAVGVPVHTDAAQAVGRIPVSFANLGVDILTCCAHKMHGPKGAGAVVARREIPRNPLLSGGGQENGWRAGTENVPAVVGFGVATQRVGESTVRHLRNLREIVERGIHAALPECVIVGENLDRLPNTTLLLVPEINTDVMLAQLDLDDVCCSSGSACASGSSEPSHVLREMGWIDGARRAAVRISWGRFSAEEDANRLVSVLKNGVRLIRSRLR